MDNIQKLILAYSPEAPPLVSLLVLAAAKPSDISVVLNKRAEDLSLSVISKGTPPVKLLRDLSAARLIGALGGVLPTDPLERVLVLEWADWVLAEVASVPATAKAVSIAVQRLKQWSFVGGRFRAGFADLVLLAVLNDKVERETNEKILKSVLGGKHNVHLRRWATQVVSIWPGLKAGGVLSAKLIGELAVGGASAKVTKKVSKSEKGAAGHMGGFANIDAKEGEVVTRFPPEPSGFLHIGHMKAAIINDHFARKYKGKLLLRFDDTNPRKEKASFEEEIVNDLKTMEIQADAVSHTSDHFDLIQSHAEKMIQKGLAYVDDAPNEQIREWRQASQPSPARDRSVEDNLKLWEEMKQASDKGRQCVLRAKIDYKSKNGCMRDPNIYRVVADIPHHRTKDKYKVYPLYDFACPIVDAHEGVTHAMRSSEYHDHDELYYYFIDKMELRKVVIVDFSRLNFSYTLLSKRLLNWFVDQGKVDGWSDPAFPTVQGLCRRGLTVTAIRQFMLGIGGSKSNNLMNINKLWALNRKVIDSSCPRFSAVRSSSTGFATLNITGLDFSGPRKEVQVLLHKKNESLGKKTLALTPTVLIETADVEYAFKQGAKITLLDFGNVRLTSKESDDKWTAEWVGDKDFKGTAKIHWVPADENVTITLDTPAPLITVPNVTKENADKIEEIATKNVHTLVQARGEMALNGLAVGAKIQLNRIGFFIVDKKGNDGSFVLVNIP